MPVSLLLLALFVGLVVALELHPDCRRLQPLAFVLAVISLLAAIPLACAPTGSPRAPGLGAVLSRVDVPRLLSCTSKLPAWLEVARCLGAEAVTQGLKAATEEAMRATEQAREASGPAGAEVSDEDRDAIAADLDAALLKLGAEIDATHTTE